MEYLGFADESYITNNRYRSASLFSFNKQQEACINSALKHALSSSDVTEFKWQKLKDARSKFCALKLLDVISDNLESGSIRIDTIIWDTQDERHSIQNRDDTANDERMFFHLIHHALRNRPRNSFWWLYPDERGCVDWDTLAGCVENQGKHIREAEKSLWGRYLNDSHYVVKEFKEVQSYKQPETQIADLFAGLIVFAKEKSELYKRWQNSSAPSLFSDMNDDVFSNRDNARFEVLDHLISRIKQMKLNISFNSTDGLRTWKPACPLNFWHYQPQHSRDKAPIKTSEHKRYTF